MRRDRLVFVLIATAVTLVSAAFGWVAMFGAVQKASGLPSGELVLGAPTPWQFNFQRPFSPVQHGLYQFHNLLFAMNLAVSALVIIMVLYAAWRFKAARNPVASQISHNTPLEVIWTIIPVIILVLVAIPSFRMNVLARTVPASELTIKVTGNQWYWDYEYPDSKVALTSVMVPDDKLSAADKDLRLLVTDNALVLPTNTNVQILLTSNDVIHSWAVPSLGVKQDAIPGRLNQTWTRIEKEGRYFGQCSVLCGVKHAFMPIEIRAVSPTAFRAWLAAKKAPAAAQPTAAEGGGEEQPSGIPVAPKAQLAPNAVNRRAG